MSELNSQKFVPPSEAERAPDIPQRRSPLADFARKQAAESAARQPEVPQDGAILRKKLTAAKAILPLFVAMIHRPGLATASASEKAEAAALLLKESFASAHLLQSDLFPEKARDRWFVSQLQSLTAALISERWKEGLDISIGPDLAAVAGVLGHVPKDGEETPLYETIAAWGDCAKVSSAEDAQAALRLSLIKSGSKLSMTVNQSWCFWKEDGPASIYNGLFDSLVALASRAATSLMGNANAAQQTMLMQSMIDKAFAFGVEEYKALARRALQEYKGAKSDEERAGIQAGWMSKDIVKTVTENADKALAALTIAVDRYCLNMDAAARDEVTPT